MTEIPNPQIDLAFDYVRNTGKNIFLTGKAGTGKTTFLHRIKAGNFKRMVVVAPTGVAAINAGGMTIHSFFQLPFGPLVPGIHRDEKQNRKFSGAKVNLIKSMDLLVIDEISMVRADLLDGIDEVLRRYRNHFEPFGGVQLLMIGDLHQLPPVVKQEEWDLLHQHYDSMYFFSSKALRKSNPVCIELKHIYRQSDNHFIELLNKVRDNRLDKEVLEALNSRYIPNFHPQEEDGYIILTSHNATAHNINGEKLSLIEKPVQIFSAKVEGDFPPYSYPTDEMLELKSGAQVMFIKNDTSPEKQYFNGKIGRISRIKDSVIYVRCQGEQNEIPVSPVLWDNVKYTFDPDTKEIKEETAGTFMQYPLKLAWAITIHKSQGSTFDRAVIDAKAAFAFGQVYVALSRCRSFEGIVLSSKIDFSSVKTDSVVKQYTDEAEKQRPDEAHLISAKREYQQMLIKELFDFRSIKRHFEQLKRQYLEHENALHGSGFSQLKAIEKKFAEIVYATSEKFHQQLNFHFQHPAVPEEHETLQLRIKSACNWFSEKVEKELLQEIKTIQILTDNKAVGKIITGHSENLLKELFVKNACLQACKNGFNIQTYIRAKADAEVDYAEEKHQLQKTPPEARVPRNIPHPELYLRLLNWRKMIADETDLELFMVLPSRSLQDLVQHLPTTTANLKQIKGIGEGKAKQFGNDIISTIKSYCLANNIQTDLLIQEEKEPKPPKVDTKALSLESFKAGKSIAEIAKERGFVESTIQGHLGHYVGTGELDISEVMPQSKVDEILSYLTEHEGISSSEVKVHFGDKYSYGEIKMVMAHSKRQNQES
jgi:hypothetical protein